MGLFLATGALACPLEGEELPKAKALRNQAMLHGSRLWGKRSAAKQASETGKRKAHGRIKCYEYSATDAQRGGRAYADGMEIVHEVTKDVMFPRVPGRPKKQVTEPTGHGIGRYMSWVRGPRPPDDLTKAGATQVWSTSAGAPHHARQQFENKPERCIQEKQESKTRHNRNRLP